MVHCATYGTRVPWHHAHPSLHPFSQNTQRINSVNCGVLTPNFGHCGCKLFVPRTKIWLPPCRFARNAQWFPIIYVDITCIEFFPKALISVENAGAILSTPLLHQFLQKSQVLNGIMWRRSMPSFTQIGQEIMKNDEKCVSALTELWLPLSHFWQNPRLLHNLK